MNEHELLCPTVNKHKQTWIPLVLPNDSKYKIMKNLARTLSLFLTFSENFYKSKMRNIMTELCLWKMIYNDKLWQSINETNQESKYLQFCRSKTDSIQNTLLTRSCLLFNFLALQDPLRLLYVLRKSSSSYYWAWLRPKHGVFKQNPLGLFHWCCNATNMLQCNQTVAMQPNCCNATKLLQCNQNVATQPNCCNATKLLQCNQNVAMQPKCCNATKMLQYSKSFSIQWLLVMTYDMTRAYISVFYYISRNSSMSSLSSWVETTSQQFSCVCRMVMLGISHGIPAACSSTDLDVPSMFSSHPLSRLMTLARKALFLIIDTSKDSYLVSSVHSCCCLYTLCALRQDCCFGLHLIDLYYFLLYESWQFLVLDIFWVSFGSMILSNW